MKNQFLRKAAMIIPCLILGFCVKAQQVPATFVMETHYLLYLPEGYAIDTAKRWPLLIFLHGSGEGGDDVEKVKANGIPKMIEEGKKFPFIIASPQAPEANIGFQPEVLNGMVNDLKKKYHVDADRIYLTGLSMGGYGTWDLAEKHPEQFAAIAPIASGGPIEKIWKLRHMPVWCFHGAKDDAVPLADSQLMIDSLKKYNSNVRFTIYPNANHNSWDVTYSNDSLYTWLLSQKKYKLNRVPLQPGAQNDYSGIYADREKDTLKIAVVNNKLMLGSGSDKIEDQIEIIPSSDTSFYISENLLTEIVFIKDSKGKFKGLWVFDEQNKTPYHRLTTAKITEIGSK
jgi:predicted esterase